MERAHSSDYKQHLGLISLIRNDLEKLSKYLMDLDNMATHKIDRIVLYIDDLDRCTPERIIENLEAVKLFLNVPKTAFIIGADPRIVKHAIEHKYKNNSQIEEDNSRIIDDYLETIKSKSY